MSTQTHAEAIGLRAHATARSDRKVAGFLLFALAAQFMTVIMLAAAIAPGYDNNTAAISDLGVIRETALLFNASLVLVGVLNLAGGYFLQRASGSGWILPVFAIAGVGATGAGLVPLNTSDLHSLFALLAFLFFNVEALLAARIVAGPMRLISLLAGGIGLAFVVLMVIGDAGDPGVFGAIGHGGAERMIVYPVMLWLAAFGGYLMADRDTGVS